MPHIAHAHDGHAEWLALPKDDAKWPSNSAGNELFK